MTAKLSLYLNWMRGEMEIKNTIFDTKLPFLSNRLRKWDLQHRDELQVKKEEKFLEKWSEEKSI